MTSISRRFNGVRDAPYGSGPVCAAVRESQPQRRSAPKPAVISMHLAVGSGPEAWAVSEGHGTMLLGQAQVFFLPAHLAKLMPTPAALS